MLATYAHPGLSVRLPSLLKRDLRAVVQRQSNNANPGFTYEEVLTIYLFVLIRKREEIKEIHQYVSDHLFGVVSQICRPTPDTCSVSTA